MTSINQDDPIGMVKNSLRTTNDIIERMKERTIEYDRLWKQAVEEKDYTNMAIYGLMIEEMRYFMTGDRKATIQSEEKSG